MNNVIGSKAVAIKRDKVAGYNVQSIAQMRQVSVDEVISVLGSCGRRPRTRDYERLMMEETRQALLNDKHLLETVFGGSYVKLCRCVEANFGRAT